MAQDFQVEDLPEGLKNLTEGYIDYAKEVIINRALVDVHDGLKPVNRRILFTLKKRSKQGFKTKSNTTAGNVLEYHPHGDSSVYQAMIPMADLNGSYQVPLLSAQGNWGGAHTTSPAAASRYTECGLHENANEYFGEMLGIRMVNNFDATTTEPEVLPVSYPAVLCNTTSGIAVGFSSNVPSFNFHDVIDLTMEYIKDGKCTTVICPDFSTGGYYIKNNKELSKLMQTGSASLKLRGRVEIVGKEIKVVEFPYGKTIQRIISQINKTNMSGVKDVGNLDDYEHGIGLVVDCTAKNKVDEVLYSLYKDTDLQSNFSADMTVILDGKPIRLGVYAIIEEWVRWRKEVLTKEYEVSIKDWTDSLLEPRAFMEILKFPELKDKLVDIVYKDGVDAGCSFILANYDNDIITPELARWLCNRRLPEYKNGGKYSQKYAELKASIDEYETKLKDLDTVIFNQLKALKNRRSSMYKRKTEVTNTDYDFASSEAEVELVRDTNPCVYSFKDGFLKKMKYSAGEANHAYEFDGTASDTLISIDNRGRLLRVYCDLLPYNGVGELGTYLPRYFDLNESDDYKIWWIDRLDGSTKMIVYTDGNIGFLETSEWLDVGRKVRVLEKGISVSVADKVGKVMDVPECLFVIDTSGRIGYEMLDSVKQKERTAKTRVFNLAKNDSIASVYGTTAIAGSTLLSNIARYQAPKLQFLEDDKSFNGDASKFDLVY